MGTYVEFRPCPAEGPLPQIVQTAQEYLAWYVSDFAEEADEQVRDLLTSLVEQGAAAVSELEPSAFATMDKLVAEFYGFMCDSPGRCLSLPPHVDCSQLRVQRYVRLHEEMRGLVSPSASHLWQFVSAGRPFAPSHRRSGYISDDGVSWVSWWSLEEVRLLASDLPPPEFFGSEFTKGVLVAAHTALAYAQRENSGLVVTAF